MINEPKRIPQFKRQAASNAVHRAVCEYLQDDGARRCLEYAVAGALACHWITGERYIPQVGSADIVIDPGPPIVSAWINAETMGGTNGLERGEYHCWIVKPGERTGEGVFPAEFVDFSSRHYKALGQLDRLVGCMTIDGMMAMTIKPPDPKPWVGEDPPEYIWHVGKNPPYRWASFVPDEACCRALGRITGDIVEPLAKLTARFLREELAEFKRTGATA